MASPLPQAQTLHWNATEICVLCPYCNQPESVPYADHTNAHFSSFCNSGLYTVSLPFSGNSWSIDKPSARLLSARGQILESSLTAPPPTEPKALKIDATLTRPGGLLPTYTASSGLKNLPASPYHLSGTSPSLRVRELASAIRHRLATSGRRDQRIAGLWNASHAVKKLAAQFVDMHIWLPDEVAVDASLRKDVEALRMRYWWEKSSSGLAGEWDGLDERLIGTDGEENSEIVRRIEELERDVGVKRFETLKRHYLERRDELDRQVKLAELVGITPADGLKEAVILTEEGHGPICNDCRRFVDGLNACFGVGIVLEEAEPLRLEAHL